MRVRTALLALVLACSPGCLVLSLQPAYDDGTIAWEPALVGTWIDAEDTATMDVQAGEWRSYRITYEHPIETRSVTAHLTVVGNERFLDVMPARGEDPGSFLVPAHAILHVSLQDNRLELTPLSYDWFDARLRTHEAVTGLSIVKDQRENVLVVSPTERLRAWLRAQPRGGPMFGAPAVFTRKIKQDA